ncbi:DUF481 domain-containing protein [Pararhizobium sp. YC-54]|uniref:DUF481 domain-containing protein n=1 Tax=Pararhizobium sp. YC-54 TaxID=2986920 RepID=UPI0021F741BE|nr:DUF481 domain-containing protein [Pararhizobium sp. YC-54]MCV9998825.1 DUF481 domain-containing protein [Pararhizobium sp. YC-54]
MSFQILSAIAGISLCSLSHVAISADLTPLTTPDTQRLETESGWTVTITPYFWGAGLRGDLGVINLPTVQTDASFGDIWNHLDFAVMAMGEARNGPYSVFADAIYIDLSGNAATPRGLLADEASIDSKTFAGLLGAGYTVLADEHGYLDIVGGVRIWSAETTIRLSGGVLDGREASDGATWVDAMAGVRGVYELTPNIFLTAWGLVGAGAANLDWDVAASIGYKFTDRISSTIGYRALGVDYDNGDGFKFDVVEHGPMVGLSIKF